MYLHEQRDFDFDEKLLNHALITVAVPDSMRRVVVGGPARSNDLNIPISPSEVGGRLEKAVPDPRDGLVVMTSRTATRGRSEAACST